MALVGRIFVILFALLLSAVAASIVTAIAFLVFAAQQLTTDPIDHILFWGLAAFGAGVTVFTSFMPTLIAVVLAEALRIRSALIYALAGAALMVAGYYSAGFGWSYEESIDRAPPPISRAAEIAVAVGVVFGLTYWTIAGRRAGAWMGKG
ncbi:MAG TPA: hypothetical protein VHD59_16260 [Pseudolabrys sp.]|jgi:hypothetical protein|nr:hypothetical protein [Pseudolabrys sp.]